MLLSQYDVFDLNFKYVSHADFIIFLGGVGDALAVHPGYQDTMPEEVPNSGTYKDLVSRFTEAVKAAQYGDRLKAAERDALRAEGEAYSMRTAQWAVIKSSAKKDPSYLANIGIPLKKRAVKSHAKAMVAAPTKFSVTHGTFSGSVMARSGRVGGGASYELQISLGDPTDESAWNTYDHFAHCRQMEVKGLEPGKVYHFRVRCLGNSGNGPWSTVVSLMVI